MNEDVDDYSKSFMLIAFIYKSMGRSPDFIWCTLLTKVTI